MRIQEFTGKTTQEAIDNGLAELGVTIADVRVDVLQEGAKGLFGLFGSKPARVRLTVMEEQKEDDQGLRDLLGSFSLNEPQKKKPVQKPVKQEKVERKPQEAAKPKEKAPKAESAKPETEKKAAPATVAAPKQTAAQEVAAEQEPPVAKSETAAQEAPAASGSTAPRARQPRKPRQPKEPKERAPRPQHEEAEETRVFVPMEPAEPFVPTEPPVMHAEDTPAGRAQRFLMDVTERMNVKVDVYVDDSKPDSLSIHMIGDTLGILIGRRGETLDALQYLTSLQVNKGREGYIRVTLDTENYRAKREDSLRRLAQRMANRAQKTGRKVVLEPMNPYERRVLHTALQNHPGVTTHSEGEEPNRRVVIMLKNQPERAPQGERAERGEKPASSRRGRGRRRGPRKGGQTAPAAAPGQEMPAVSAQAEETPAGTVHAESSVASEMGVEE